MIGKAEYSIFILQKLQKLESLSSKYEDILRLISKRIRRDLWNTGKNDFILKNLFQMCDWKMQGLLSRNSGMIFLMFQKTAIRHL